MTPGIPTKAAEILRAEIYIGRFSIRYSMWISGLFNPYFRNFLAIGFGELRNPSTKLGAVKCFPVTTCE